MACSNGRPKLPRDQERRLFAESAGTCLLCNTPLFVTVGHGTRSISIAEQAHVIAHSDRGPRADETQPKVKRHDPENIVLLCPTCHTQIDKVPDSFPAAYLLSKKKSRAAAVAMIGGTPEFETRSDARCAVREILQKNRLIFQKYGPDPRDGSIRTTEEAERWSRHVLEDIVPGNELIVAIVKVNERLATDKDREIAEALRLHTCDLAEKHRGLPLTAPARRFPAAAEDLFADDVNI